MANFSKLYDFIPNVQTKDFLPSPNRWLNISSILLVSTFVIAGVTASWMKYDDTVDAVATVRPSGELSSIQSTVEGVVESILVSEDSVVKKGDPIAVIGNPKYVAQKNQIIGNIQKLTWQINQIDAQFSSLDNQALAQIDRTNRLITSAQSELQRRQQEHTTKEVSSQSDLEEAEANLQISQRNLEQGQIELKSQQAALSAARAKQRDYRFLIKNGAVARDKVDEVDLLVEQQVQSVAKQQQEIRQRAQIVQAAQAKIRRAKSSKLNLSSADLSIASDSIAQEKASGKISLVQLEREKQVLAQQRIDLKQQIESNRQELATVEQQLRQKVIYAPIDGVILSLRIRNPKQPVALGTEIAQMTPRGSQLLFKASVSAQDIGKIKSKQKAILQISAYPYPDYGTLKGEVISIAPDSTETPNANPALDPKAAANKTYQVTVLPENVYLVKNKTRYWLKPGMESKIKIITAQDTILTFFLRKIRLMTDI